MPGRMPGRIVESDEDDNEVINSVGGNPLSIDNIDDDDDDDGDTDNIEDELDQLDQLSDDHTRMSSELSDVQGDSDDEEFSDDQGDDEEEQYQEGQDQDKQDELDQENGQNEDEEYTQESSLSDSDADSSKVSRVSLRVLPKKSPKQAVKEVSARSEPQKPKRGPGRPRKSAATDTVADVTQEVEHTRPRSTRHAKRKYGATSYAEYVADFDDEENEGEKEEEDADSGERRSEDESLAVDYEDEDLDDEEDYFQRINEQQRLLRAGNQIDMSRLTKRQRTMLEANNGGDKSQEPSYELLELPDVESKRKKRLTSEELALKRSEMARRRKNLSEKRLEEEKMETINKLLKKQATSRRGRARDPSRAGSTYGDNDERGSARSGGDELLMPQQPPRAVRWRSSQNGEVLAIPRELVRFFERQVAQPPRVNPSKPVTLLSSVGHHP